MRRWLRQLLKLLPVLALAVLPEVPAQAPAPFSVWVLSSLDRAPPQGSPGPSRSARIEGAGGEAVSFQIVLQAPPGGLHDATAAASNLTGANRHVIPAADLVFYREVYVQVSQSSPNRRGSNPPLGAGSYPDALVPFIDPQTGWPPRPSRIPSAPFSVAPGMNQPLWVDVMIPRGAAPGDYSGSISVTADAGEIDVPVSLHIWNFDLPPHPSLKSVFVYWNSPPPPGEIAMLLEHRLFPQKIPPGACPGGNCPTVSSAERSLEARGLTITGTGLWSGADNGHCVMTAAPSVSAFRAAAAGHDSHLGLYNYTADEITNCPHLFPQLIQWARNMHRAGINNLVVMTPTPALFDDGAGAGRSAVDIWVVLPAAFDAAKQTIAQALAKGDQVWSYNAVSQDSFSPKWLIDYDPIDFRIQPGFINQSLGLTGILYWRIDRWTPDPWKNVNTVGVFDRSNYPGEGMLVYPGADAGLAGVAPSLRLKELRDGSQDFDYVEILKQLGQKDWALSEIQAVAADWHHWTRDPAAFLAVRHQLGEKIDSLEAAQRHHKAQR